jgi:diguanylate cyclase (GGDEF)-like protein/PAS domain S-box-containing protein
MGDMPGMVRLLFGDDPSGPIAGAAVGAVVAWVAFRLLYRGRREAPAAGPKAVANPISLPAANLSEEQYHHLFDSNPVATLVCDTRKWRCLEANAAALTEYGYSRDELLKLTLTDLGLADDAERLANTMLQLGATTTDGGTWVQQRKDGSTFDAELTTFRAQFSRQQARIVCVRDVTRRIRMEQTLWQDVERQGLIAKATSDSLLDWDLKTNAVWCSDNFSWMFGGQKVDSPYTMEAWFDQIHTDDRARVQQHLLDATKSTDDRWRDEFRVTRPDGSVIHAYARGHITRGDDKRAKRVVLVFQDITVRKEAEERTRFLADHDELTGLPNRNLFKQALNQALQRAERSNKMLSILFFDLDRFKNINDSLGHDAGDEVLRTVAERLNSCVRKIDVVARFGGDEFAVLTEGLTAEDQAGTVARKILDELGKPMLLAGRQYRPAASIGISTYPTDGRDAQTLQKHADIAMYRAKEEGRSTFQFYSEQLNTHSLQRLEFESNLNNALNNHEFVLHYQPKLDVKTGAVTSMEALIRWVSPQFGFVSPGQFISVAEETGLILPLGRWVAQTACVQNSAWQKGGLPPLRVAINISARQMADKGLVEFIAETVRKTGLTPASLELEITESAVMSNHDYAEKVLNQLKEMGFHLTMDDFGTGYSSLAYLKRFPFDTVKVDQSFVRGIPGNSDDCAIVEAIIAMAHSLQLKVVAEGVETQEQFDFLGKLGCDQIQGYYFSKPIPSNEVVMLLFKIMKGGGKDKMGAAAAIENAQKAALKEEPAAAPKALLAATGERPAAQAAEPTKLALQEEAGKDQKAAPATVEEKPAFDMLDFKIELPPDPVTEAKPVEASKAKEA